MKIVYIVIAVILVGFVGVNILGFMFTSPLSKEDVISKVDKNINDLVEKSELTDVVLRIYSETQSIDDLYSTSDDVLSKAFHAASVGKTFTAVMVGKLVDENKLNFDDKISLYLKEELLSGLFVYEGIDYKSEVTISNLLGHTSGIGDYFEDKTHTGNSMKELINNSPEKIWTPEDLLSFTRDKQESVGKPNEQFHYSDTGYILLGMIIEEVSNTKYHTLLSEKILNPVKMNDSYMMFLSEPLNEKKELLPIYLNQKDLAKSNALTVDWTGGGIVSTVDDLLKFHISLNQGEILEKETYNKLKTITNKKMDGLHYGLGFAELRFNEFSMFLNGMNPMKGAIGANGSFMLYDEEKDLYLIANFGSIDNIELSIQTLIKVLMTYDRLKI